MTSNKQPPPFSSTTKLLLTSAYKAAILAVQPSSLVHSAVQIESSSGILKVVDQLTKKVTIVQLLDREVCLIGAGKAVLGMATELLRKVEEFNVQNLQKITITKGQLNVPHGSSVSEADADLLHRHSIKLFTAARNNLPDKDSIAATQSILDLVKERKESNFQKNSQILPLILAFISGGGSALLALPRPPATLADKQAVISCLVKAGADIVALNTVRGSLSAVKQGQLAELVLSESPRALELVTFLISDIIDDPIDLIASGPTVLGFSEDKTSSHFSPLEVLQKFNVSVEDKIRQLLETPKSSKAQNLNFLQNILIGNNALAVAAAKEVIQKSSKENFKVVVQESAVCGDVKEVVKNFIANLEVQGKEVKKGTFAGVCLLAGGETTVDMKGAKEIGLGGRCQEMGLLFLKHQISIFSSVFSRITVLFAGTDGQDGPTSAAGVVLSWPENTAKIVENEELKKAFEDSITLHDSHNFFQRYFSFTNSENCLLETGPSGTNVMDLYTLIGEF